MPRFTGLVTVTPRLIDNPFKNHGGMPRFTGLVTVTYRIKHLTTRRQIHITLSELTLLMFSLRLVGVSSQTEEHAAHFAFLPRIPIGRASPIRCRDIAFIGWRLLSMNAAASAYGMIISGTREAKNAASKRSDIPFVAVGVLTGKQSIAMRNLSIPIGGSSTIGPGQSNRQSNTEVCKRL